MPFVPILNAVEVEVRWAIPGSLCENRFYVNCGHSPIGADLTAISTVVLNWVNASYKPIVNASVSFRSLVLTDKSVAGGLQITTPLTGNGSVTGTYLPNETSFAVKLTTGYSGRNKRGRWFMPPPVNGDLIDQNHVGVPYASAAASALQALIGDLFGLDYRMGVVSLTHGGVPVAAPVVLDYTVATYADTTLDSQRGRKPA